ncbi:MAG: hypothetical protein PVI81_02905 [Anaerolineales bacterium]|jgi:hypothetical protein
MLERRSISRDNLFLVIVVVGALALIAISYSLLSGGRLGSSSVVAGPAFGREEINAPARARIAEQSRLNALAGQYYNLHGSTAWVRAGIPAAAKVEAERLTATAGHSLNLYGSTAWVHAGLSPALRVEADRLNIIAGQYYNLYGSTVWVKGGLSAAQQVEADRLTGLAGTYVNLYGTTVR